MSTSDATRRAAGPSVPGAVSPPLSHPSNAAAAAHAAGLSREGAGRVSAGEGGNPLQEFETLLQAVQPAAGRGHSGSRARFTRRELKSILASDTIRRVKELWDAGDGRDPQAWWAARDYRRNNPVLAAAYERANAIGDALGAGSAGQRGLGMARDRQGRVLPSRDNLLRAVKHLRTQGWDDQAVAALLMMDAPDLQLWVLGRPGDDELLQPASPNDRPQV